MVEDEFKGRPISEAVKAVPSGVTYKWASQEMAHAHSPELSTHSMARTHSGLRERDMSSRQEQVRP